ncbi:GcrA family cell cycle regulator [Ensifer aridi]|uniref:GcrA family cell cycle regulator n=1 Tax=Ensifer aridi TaxID=1708715 RepID=UPI001FCE19C9|nr:GcrA family cell cycle regulator [Ensifer aridi]
MTIQHLTVDIEAASKLWKDDLSASQIATRFGVTRSVIVGLAFRNRNLFPWRGDVGKKAAAPRVRRKAPEIASEVELLPPTAYDAERLPSAKLLHERIANSSRSTVWCQPQMVSAPQRFAQEFRQIKWLNLSCSPT